MWLHGPTQAAEISVVSFNIQFLGQFKERDNKSLAELLKSSDLVFVQELVAPPYKGTFPNGDPYKPDPEATVFFEEMKTRGFQYVLSEEDTGSGLENHLNSSATEWFVAFYKPQKVKVAQDLNGGFLAVDRTRNPDYERVPYAFPFRAGKADLIFISVHLKPNSDRKSRERRAHELDSIANWIRSRPGKERDYVILGDMNIENCAELHAVLPANYQSLNQDCKPTNTNVNSPRPYDHVMYDVFHSSREIDVDRGLQIINLIDEMRAHWPASAGPYPGNPYKHDLFRTRFSDHHPISFKIRTDGPDDD